MFIQLPNFVLKTRDHFIENSSDQNFDIPNSIIFYITKNPTTPKVYQKLVDSCKYFFIKNPIIIFHCLCFDEQNEQKICVQNWNDNGKCSLSVRHKFSRRILLNLDIASKIWILGGIRFGFVQQNSITSKIFSKLYKFNGIETCVIHNQTITFNEFLSISVTLKFCTLLNVIINDKEGTEEVSLERIIEKCPKIFRFEHTSHPNSKAITAETVENLIKLPHLPKKFVALSLPEVFDIQTFFNFLKKSKIFFISSFDKYLSNAEYINKLDVIVDEIIETKTFDYFPPFISYPGLDIKKYRKLESIFLKCRRN